MESNQVEYVEGLYSLRGVPYQEWIYLIREAWRHRLERGRNHHWPRTDGTARSVRGCGSDGRLARYPAVRSGRERRAERAGIRIGDRCEGFSVPARDELVRSCDGGHELPS